MIYKVAARISKPATHAERTVLARTAVTMAATDEIKRELVSSQYVFPLFLLKRPSIMHTAAKMVAAEVSKGT